MKNHKLIFYFSGVLFSIVSCDKVHDKIYQTENSIEADGIDTTLLPDTVVWNDYVANYWNDFSQNSNNNRNVLVENFTGHKCTNCLYGDSNAYFLEKNNPGRVFNANIHSGPNGYTVFQNTEGPLFWNDFTNPQGLEISTQLTDDSFIGLPMGLNNRKIYTNQLFQMPYNWASNVSEMLITNDLKINLQANTNYFTQTRGLFVHTEIDVLTPISDELYQVVYLIEDSVVSAQSTIDSTLTPSHIDVNYIHRNIHRGCIDSQAMGRKLIEADKVDKYGNPIPGNKYYLNYSYQLPAQYNRDNMHLLIYVYNKITKEIYQVIRKDF